MTEHAHTYSRELLYWCTYHALVSRNKQTNKHHDIRRCALLPPRMSEKCWDFANIFWSKADVGASYDESVGNCCTGSNCRRAVGISVKIAEMMIALFV